MLSHIEILHIEACPSWEEAGARLQFALDESALTTVSIANRLVNTIEEALDAGFSGSPTILFDGINVFPAEERPTALACRLFLTDDGPSGVPPVSQLIQAVRTHA